MHTPLLRRAALTSIVVSIITGSPLLAGCGGTGSPTGPVRATLEESCDPSYQSCESDPDECDPDSQCCPADDGFVAPSQCNVDNCPVYDGELRRQAPAR